MRQFRAQPPEGMHTSFEPRSGERICRRSVPMQAPRTEIQKVVRTHPAPDRLYLVRRVQQIIGKFLHVLKRRPYQRPEDLFGNDLSFAPKRTGLPPGDLGG
jgi:hypothetical protein